MERFIGEIEETWALRRSSVQFGEAEGACLPEMRLFSEFAPCYVAARGMLLLGWNAQSIAKALAENIGPGPSEWGGMVVHLDRLEEADLRLRDSWVPEAPAPRLRYAWDRLSTDVREEGGEVRMRLALEKDVSVPGVVLSGETTARISGPPAQ